MFKKFFRKLSYIWWIFFGLVLLCGAIFTTSAEPVLRIILGIGAFLFVLFELKMIRNTDFEEEAMLDEYEKLYNNHTLSIEKIDDIMTKKYGDRYKKYSEREE